VRGGEGGEKRFGKKAKVDSNREFWHVLGGEREGGGSLEGGFVEKGGERGTTKTV